MNNGVENVRGQEALDLAREYTVNFHFGSGGNFSRVYSIDEVDSFGTPMLQVNFVNTSVGNEGRLWYPFDRWIGLEVVDDAE